MIEVLKQAIAWAEKHGEMVFASGGMDTVKSMNAWVMAGNQAIKDLESQEPVAITDDDGVAWAYGTKGGKLPANKVLYDKPYDVFEYLGYCPECGASPDNPQPHPPQRTEPVFCEYCGGNDENPPDHCMDCARPQRTWQGLTQSDFNEIYDLFANKVSSDFIFEKMYSTIEAKLKEKNNA